MQLVALAAFGEYPEDPADLPDAFVEAEWLEKWRAAILADAVLSRMFGKK